MSDSDSFIREVTEEVDRDRMNRQLKRWAPYIAGALIVIVGLAAAWNWKQAQDRAAAEEIGRILLSPDLGETAGAERALEALDGPPEMLARFRLAEVQLGAGDREGALQTYDAIAARGDVERAYTDLAALQAARIAAVTQSADAVFARLEPLEAEGAPYRLMALELKAVLLLNNGSAEAGHDLMRQIMADPESTQTLSDRMRQILISTGGETGDDLG